MSRLLVLVLLIVPAWAADKATEIDALLQRYHDLGWFNGSALISDQDQVVLKKGYGFANMEWSIPNSPDTKFRLGSLTKQFTAALVLQLVEQGKVDLNAPISRYLPSYPKRTGDKITLHQLLNHTSGIPGYTELPDYGPRSRERSTPDAFTERFSKLELLFEPGTKFSYNNSAYFLLGLIAEKVTGQPYEHLLNERIFGPAGMQDSGYDSTVPLLTKRAAGYDSTLEGYRNTSFLDMGQPYAAGSLYSTAEDLLKWDAALRGDKILTTASREKMYTPGLSEYGYGVYIRKQSGVTTVEHGGSVNGFNTILSRDLEPRRVIVLLNNTGAAPLEPMATGIRAILEGRRAPSPQLRSSPVLYKTYLSSGIAVMMDRLKKLKANNEYDTGVGELSRVTNQLLTLGKSADAVELARRIAADSPKSAAAAILLGRAERAAGHRVEALQAVGRAIELSDTPRALPTLTEMIRDLSVVDTKP
jgi:CubicO group peptidase (beta-lactamase class C family)